MITLAFILINFAIFIELLLSRFLTKNESQIKNTLIYTTIFLSFGGSVILLVENLCLASIFLFVLAVFRAINILRIAKNRMHYKELRSKTIRSSIALALFSQIALVFFIYGSSREFNTDALIYIAGLQLLAAAVLSMSVLLARTIYRYKSKKEIDAGLPTVTVCVPARNETEDLSGCIESVISSLYPKLEIIVLDDCSHDNTPEVIKKYAHDGVRFIKGDVPSDNWLAKNSAYARLAQEASSDILLFIGVDVRFQPDSIAEIVKQMGDSSMLSILPRRGVEREGSLFIQPVRYWWELGLPRFGMSTPPVLSTCWAVRAEELEKIGGFEGVKKAVKPESVFAREFKKRAKYAFIISNKIVAVTSIKAPKQQFQTAQRVRYVQLGNRPETVMKTILFEWLFMLGPYVVFIWALAADRTFVASLALASIIMYSLANGEIHRLVLRYLWPFGYLTFPFLVLADTYLMLKSMWAYEFGKVIWKERNICIPLLKVEKSLPKV